MVVIHWQAASPAMTRVKQASVALLGAAVISTGLPAVAAVDLSLGEDVFNGNCGGSRGCFRSCILGCVLLLPFQRTMCIHERKVLLPGLTPHGPVLGNTPDGLWRLVCQVASLVSRHGLCVHYRSDSYLIHVRIPAFTGGGCLLLE